MWVVSASSSTEDALPGAQIASHHSRSVQKTTLLVLSQETILENGPSVYGNVQAAEGKSEAMKKQQAQDLKREAHLAAEAEANKRSTAERDQALRLAAQEARTSALPSGALSEQNVQRQAQHQP